MTCERRRFNQRIVAGGSRPLRREPLTTIRLVLSITAFSITRLLTKGRGRERRRGRERLGKRRKQTGKPSSKNHLFTYSFKEMLRRVVAMLTRLIARFDRDDSRNVGSYFLP